MVIGKSGLNFSKDSRVLIIHHWDCDGICAAALLIKYLSDVNRDIKIFTETGEIGKYYLNPDKINSLKKIRPHHLIICDYASGDHGVRKISRLRFNKLVIKF